MAGGTVAIEWLKEVPHLDVTDLRGRTVPLHALYDETGWRLWFPGKDRLQCVPAPLVEGRYFATAPAGAGDLHFPLLEFVDQRVLWPDVQRFSEGIYADVQNAGAAFSKL